MKKFNYYFRTLITQSSILVGGQAVMEGVMMRVPGAYATAVRSADGTIQIDKHKFKSIICNNKILKKPIIRGIVCLFESMKIGYSTLQWSAEIIEPNSDKPKNKIIELLLTALSIFIAISLFFAAPIGLTTWLFDKEQDAFFFNLISGIFRISFFLIYLILISFMSDVHRLFQYHGAEHKTVYNFESGKKLTIENAQLFSTQHPRCGTSFIFIIMIVAIISFAILDTIVIYLSGNINIWLRFFLHIPFIPIVSGLGYEVLKLTAKNQNNLIFKLLSLPGLWLQNITTKQPDDQQIEVALFALKAAFGNNLNEYVGKEFVAEAIE